MKALAQILIFAAFLAGAFLAVLDPFLVDWTLMLPVLAMGVAGLVWYKRTHHAETRADHKLTGNITVLKQSLVNIVAHLESLNGRKEDLPVYEARFEIDRLFREDLNNFAEARESMIHVFGIQNYADVMSSFAAGERYINRVWCASADGYVDEVNTYLTRALDQFIEARDLLAKLSSQNESRAAPQTVSG